jgi:hypothetical protein
VQYLKKPFNRQKHIDSTRTLGIKSCYRESSRKRVSWKDNWLSNGSDESEQNQK